MMLFKLDLQRLEARWLHNLAIRRQVHSCSCPLNYFIRITFQRITLSLALKAKYHFMNEMNCDVVDNGIMDCVARSEYRVVEIPLYREREPRINNKCSQSFLRCIDSADHRSWYGTGKSTGCSFIHISTDARSGCLPWEEWWRVGARNFPIMCCRMMTLVSS